MPRTTSLPQFGGVAKPDWAAALEKLDVGEVRFGEHDRTLYSTDASLYQVMPLGVVLPRTAEQVARLVAFCLKHGVPLLPRGGGTSLAGQCTGEAMIVDLSAAQRRLVAIDINSDTCDVEAGITPDDLNRQLAPHRLMFAPDPATVAQAVIGGCIGNNAAGARSIRYGRTSENIAAIDIVLGSGECTRLGAHAGRHNAVARRLAEGCAAIVRQHAASIRERFPKTVRRNAGYGLDMVLHQLDRGIEDIDLDLSGLICGSEGTLGIVTAATLKLHPLPLARGLAIAAFDSVESAVDAIAPLLATRPTAVELLDDVVIAAARNNAVCGPIVDLLPRVRGGDPRAVLYVEYQADQSLDEIDVGFAALRDVLPGAAVEIYRDAARLADVWTLRKSGEALLHGLSAHRKPLTFVEDNAVPVENLPRFVREFRQIVERHGTRAAFWAHASVGLLHVRPLLDLHDAADQSRLLAIAEEVADLAKVCGGVMSGEHGDGRARGPLLERFFGADLMGAFADVKRLFDPRGILNPGNIIGAGPVASIVTNLRIQKEISSDAAAATFFDYTDQGDFRGAVEMCNGAGFCRKMVGGTMCPSYRALLDERHSTRGRGNALRAAIFGNADASESSRHRLGAAWNDAETIKTLDLCLSCKACKTECPSNVDVARLKAEYTAQRYRAVGAPLQAQVFGHVRRLYRVASLLPRLSNAIAQSPLVRRVTDRILKLAPNRSLPRFAKSLYRQARLKRARAGQPRVVLFADCFTTYNDPHIGLAAAAVLEAFGYAVELPNVGCCGRSMISTGLMDAAAASADGVIAALAPFVDDERVVAVLVCEPSCLSSMVDDWLQMKLAAALPLRQRLAKKAMLVEDFLEEKWDQHPVRPIISGAPQGGVYHGHCHQKALWGQANSLKLLKRVCGADRVQAIDSGCCGMAGSFGFTADRYALSMQIGELSLFPAVRAAAANVEIMAPGTSCRHQIKDGTGRHAAHPIEVIANWLGVR